MKKKILTVVSGLCFLFGLLSCQNQIVDSNESSDVGYIKLSIKDDDSTRTVKPTNNADVYDFKDLVLTGKKDGQEEIEIGKWNSYLDLENESNIEIAAGMWDFTLKAKRYGASFSQTIINKTVIADKQAYLSFYKMALTNDTVKTGAVKITVLIPGKKSDFSKVTGRLSLWDNVANKETFGRDYSLLDSSEDKSYDEVTFEGTGTLTKTFDYIEATVEDSDIPENYGYTFTASVTNTDGSVLIVPSAVQVKTGYKSYGTIGAKKRDAVSRHEVSVTYTYGNKTFVQAYTPESSILSAGSCGFTNGSQKIDYWSTNSDGNGEKYSVGDQPKFTQNVTLYANWMDNNQRKITYHSNDGRDEKFETKTEYNIDLNLKTIQRCSFTGDEEDFLGWDTKADGTGTRYNAGDEITLTKDMILYAQWCTTIPSSDRTSVGYMVSDGKEWNAVFNRKGCESEISGVIIIDSDLELSVVNMSLVKDKTFSGILNGYDGKKEHTITTTDVLFNSISSTGIVKNLTIDGSKTKSIGGVVANINEGTIDNIKIKDDIISAGKEISNYGVLLGGICGLNKGTIKNCSVSGNVSSSAADSIGGYAGVNAGLIEECDKTSGDISSSKASANVGGIAGRNVDDIKYCNSGVQITASGSESNAGGIAGLNNADSSISKIGAIFYCVSWSDITVDSMGNVGGIAGKSVMTSAQTEYMKYCAAGGNLSGGKWMGGLIGYNEKTRAVYSYSCLNSATNAVKFGGLYGYELDGNGTTGWENCYACTKNVSIVYCTWTSSTSGRNGTISDYRTSSISAGNIGGTSIWKSNSISSSYGGLPYIIVK